jgi:hypothetical protein
MRSKEAAEATGRTIQAVWARRRALGLPDGRANWTAEDDEDVRALPAKEAAQRSGRTLKAVYERRRALGLPAALHTAFKSRCVVEGVTIQDRVRELIERDVAANRPATPSDGRGGSCVRRPFAEKRADRTQTVLSISTRQSATVKPPP